MTPQEQLNADAEKHAKLRLGADFTTLIYEDSKDYTFGTFAMNDFKAGALSLSAANGCNKWVEIAKIEAQIWALQAHLKFTDVVIHIEKLKQELENLKQQQ